MKLNKQTVSYIESLVDEKAKVKRDKLQAELDDVVKKDSELRDVFKAGLEKIEAEAQKKGDALRVKLGFVLGKTWSCMVRQLDCEFSGDDDCKTKFQKQLDAARKKLSDFDETVKQKKTEVIAKLSLGGTVADLERLIAELKF